MKARIHSKPSTNETDSVDYEFLNCRLINVVAVSLKT